MNRRTIEDIELYASGVLRATCTWANRMGWEWRCFVPLPTAVELREATTGGDGNPVDIEARTDHYLLVASTAVGVKLRGGRGLEVKSLKDGKQRGAQKWKKEVIGDQEDPQEGALAQADSFFDSAATKESLRDGAGAQTADLARAHRTCGCYWVSVQKQRQQAWLDFGDTRVAGEQTALVLQLHRSLGSGGDPVGKPIHYRTFAFEGAPAPDLYLAVERWLGLPSAGEKSGWQNAVRDKLGPGAIIGGYPEVVHAVFGHFLYQPAHGAVATTEGTATAALAPARA